MRKPELPQRNDQVAGPADARPCHGAQPVRRWGLRRLREVAAALAVLLFSVAPLVAQSPAAPQRTDPVKTDAERARFNANLVGIITGSPSGKYMPLGTDLARLLDDRTSGAMRLNVAFGYGSVQNIDDLINLNGVDLAIVQGDVLDWFRRDPAVHARLRRLMRYVTRLHREEIHVLARGDLRSIRALDGRKVSIGAPGSGSQITARNLFERLGIRPQIIETGPKEARDDLIAGRIDAMLFVVGKGASLFRDIAGDVANRAGLAFVPFEPQEGAFEPYEEAVLSASDYPALIPQGQEVAVRAVPSVLAVYAWAPGQPRHGPVSRFVERFFDRAQELGRRPGFERELWCQVDLAAPVAGWERFSTATAWLARNSGRPTQLCDENTERDHSCNRRFFDAVARDGISLTDPASPLGQTLYRGWQASEGRDCPAGLAQPGAAEAAH
jgi:TRAP transporter TAXI family solute receptor